MKKHWINGLLIGCVSLAHAQAWSAPAVSEPSKQIRVAVIDTGFGPWKGHFIPLCPTGHADFSGSQAVLMNEPPIDEHGHGTHISTLIHQAFSNAIISNVSDKRNLAEKIEAMKDKSGYCQIIIRFYKNKGSVITDNMARAIEYTATLGVSYVNISGGGVAENERETAAIKALLDKGVKVITAAGNNGTDLREQKYFPALSDPRTIRVGAIDEKGKRVNSSNFGQDITQWEIGYQLKSAVPIADGIVVWAEFTGTSQATAVVTGKMLREELTNKGKKNATTRSVTGNQRP